MAKPIPEHQLQAIVQAVAALPQGAGIGDIERALPQPVARRSLQYHLSALVDTGRIIREGRGRWTRYSLAPPAAKAAPDAALPLSRDAQEVQRYVRQPLMARKPTAYQRSFLEGYRPNHSALLGDAERRELAAAGALPADPQPAGTFARQILSRLLIDLSWNSSRLEGNTYSLLDTQRLLDFGAEAQGKTPLEAQMILNHKNAIAFLVDEAAQTGFNKRTVLNLHALLADNLLADPQAPGRLRRMAVGIAKSAFQPLANPQLLEECFAQVLATADAIKDPFEQALFAMVQLPYLQPFEDVNKRVSRLAANIPLIRANLAPLSFVDVPADIYTEAMLGVYELRRPQLLRDLFIHAYKRSAQQYAAVRQTIGEPDHFRLRHRAALQDLVQSVVCQRLGRRAALRRTAEYAARQIPPAEQDRFRQTAERELMSLHEGNFARYRLTSAQFQAWHQTWQATAP